MNALSAQRYIDSIAPLLKIRGFEVTFCAGDSQVEDPDFEITWNQTAVANIQVCCPEVYGTDLTFIPSCVSGNRVYCGPETSSFHEAFTKAIELTERNKR